MLELDWGILRFFGDLNPLLKPIRFKIEKICGEVLNDRMKLKNRWKMRKIPPKSWFKSFFRGFA